jgi:ABC-2 type transport system permease protein
VSTATAFLQRDFQVAWSYRFSFIVQNASLMFSLLSLRFVSDLFSGMVPDALAPYGGDYFSFVLVGVAVSFIAYPVLQCFANAVRGAQTTGTLEAMFLTRTSPSGIVLGAGVYPIAVATLQLIFLVAVGAIVLGAHINLANLGLVLLVLALTVATLVGIGLFSAAFVLVFKQREPFTGAFLAGSFLLSGVMYPTSVLPAWLSTLAPLLPLTHTLELSRRLFIDAAETGPVMLHLAALSGFAIALPAGFVAVNLAVGIAKRAGSLAQY